MLFNYLFLVSFCDLEDDHLTWVKLLPLSARATNPDLFPISWFSGFLVRHFAHVRIKVVLLFWVSLCNVLHLHIHAFETELTAGKYRYSWWIQLRHLSGWYSAQMFTELYELWQKSTACKVLIQLRRCPLNIVNISLDSVLDAAFTRMLHHHWPVQKHVFFLNFNKNASVGNKVTASTITVCPG